MKKGTRSKLERGAATVEQGVLVASLLLVSSLSLGPTGQEVSYQMCRVSEAFFIPPENDLLLYQNPFDCDGGTDSTDDDADRGGIGGKGG